MVTTLTSSALIVVSLLNPFHPHQASDVAPELTTLGDCGTKTSSAPSQQEEPYTRYSVKGISFCVPTSWKTILADGGVRFEAPYRYPVRLVHRGQERIANGLEIAVTRFAEKVPLETAVQQAIAKIAKDERVQLPKPFLSSHTVDGNQIVLYDFNFPGEDGVPFLERYAVAGFPSLSALLRVSAVMPHESRREWPQLSYTVSNVLTSARAGSQQRVERQPLRKEPEPGGEAATATKRAPSEAERHLVGMWVNYQGYYSFFPNGTVFHAFQLPGHRIVRQGTYSVANGVLTLDFATVSSGNRSRESRKYRVGPFIPGGSRVLDADDHLQFEYENGWGVPPYERAGAPTIHPSDAALLRR